MSEDDFCGNLIMDEMDLAFEKYDELFGTAYNSSKDLFEHGGLESLFEKHEVVLSTLFFFFYQYLTNVKDVYMVLTLSLCVLS